MAREISISKKVVGCALFKMQKVTNGRGLVEIYRSFMLLLAE
jgi:hypothetical protein